MPQAVDYAEKPIQLKKVLKVAQVSDKQFTNFLKSKAGVTNAVSTIRHMLNHAYIPRRNFDVEKITAVIAEEFHVYLQTLDMQPDDIWKPMEIITDTETGKILPSTGVCEYKKKLKLFMEVTMLRLDTMKHFKLSKNPFANDISKESEMFMGSSHIFALEVMRQTAESGGFAVITGQVGAGKTTMRRKFSEEARSNKSYQIIYPQSIDKTKLNARYLLQSIIFELTEKAPVGGLEALSRQASALLIEASRNNIKSVLVIEEAHDLTVHSLKILKRLWEIEDGLQRVLGIILIGQNELENRLYGSGSLEIREVTARTSHARVEALSDEMQSYVRHRLKSNKVDINTVITPEALGELGKRTLIKDREGREQSTAYPLLINNIMIRLMNYAVDMGEELITKDVVIAAGV